MSSQKVRSRKAGPESWKVDGPRKEICKCCRKELGLFRGNIAMFRGKCLSCQQKICPSCVANNYCHKCSIRQCTKLEPTDLMQLSGKRLLEISSTLHFHNPQGYEKAELVEVILAIYGKKWKRPIPPEPSTVLVVGGSGGSGASGSEAHDDESEGEYRCQKCQKLTRTADCRHCTALSQLALEPESLMLLSGRELHGILDALDVSDDQPREKGELVALILDKCGAHRNWKPPIPDPPASRPRSATPDSETSVNGSSIPSQLQSPSSTTTFNRSSSHNDSLANTPDNTAVGGESNLASDGPSRPEQQPTVSAIYSSSTSSASTPNGGVASSSSTSTSPSFTPNHGPMDWTGERSDHPSPVPPLSGSDDAVATEETRDTTTRTVPEERRAEEVREDDDSDGEPDEGAEEAAAATGLDRSALDAVAVLEDVASVDMIGQLKVHQLKSILRGHGVDYEGCCEKWDLADRVTALWLVTRMQESMSHEVPSASDASQVDESFEAIPDLGSVADTVSAEIPTASAPSGPRVYLRSDVPNLLDLASADAIHDLSVPQLKILLQKHSVHYTGCLERSELAGRVSELWNEAKKRESTEDISEDEVCKICMDAYIDCVLLECGHMVSCTECGRQMSECPICRQYVVRVVHTFKV